jgi:hypothetical protein
MEQPKKLLDQVRDVCRVKHYSRRTEDAYADWIKRYILFHKKRHPKDMGVKEIEAFLTHLAVEGNVAASTQNQALSALLFLLPRSPPHRSARNHQRRPRQKARPLARRPHPRRNASGY